MYDYKAIMDLLEEICAFEEEHRPKNVERALKIASEIAHDENTRGHSPAELEPKKREFGRVILSDRDTRCKSSFQTTDR